MDANIVETSKSQHSHTFYLNNIELAYMIRMTRLPSINDETKFEIKNKQQILPLRKRSQSQTNRLVLNTRNEKRLVKSAPAKFYSSKSLLNQINSNMRQFQQKTTGLNLNLNVVELKSLGKASHSIMRSTNPIQSKSMNVDEWLYARSFANKRRPLAIVKDNLHMQRVEDVLDLKKMGKIGTRAAQNRVEQIKLSTEETLKQIERIHLNVNFNYLVDSLKKFLKECDTDEKFEPSVSKPSLCYKSLKDNRTLAKDLRLVGYGENSIK
jgi:hypothetical protein